MIRPQADAPAPYAGLHPGRKRRTGPRPWWPSTLSQRGFLHPEGEVFARDWVYLPASTERRFSLPERLAQLADLQAREQRLTTQRSALNTQLALLQTELAEARAQAQRAAAWQDYQQASLASAQADYQLALSHQEALKARALTLSQELAQSERGLQQLQGEQALMLEQIDASQVKLAELTLLRAGYIWNANSSGFSRKPSRWPQTLLYRCSSSWLNNTSGGWINSGRLAPPSPKACSRMNPAAPKGAPGGGPRAAKGQQGGLCRWRKTT